MKILTVEESKARFSEILKEILAYLVSKSERKPEPRKLGILQGKGKAVFQGDFKMNKEEFIGL